MLSIAFDVGGVLSKYPEIFRKLVMLLEDTTAELWVISDMHPVEKIIDMLYRNNIPIRSDQVRSADYVTHGERCKAVLCKELGIDILIDDFAGYVAVPGSPPVRLLVMPDP